jgi:hypothetical protein
MNYWQRKEVLKILSSYDKMLTVHEIEETDQKDPEPLRNKYGRYFEVRTEEMICRHRHREWETVWVWDSEDAEAEYNLAKIQPQK